jgi:hypothetical protein
LKPKQIRRDSRRDDVVVKTSAFGITAERAAALARSVTRHRAVVKFLGRSRNRLLSFEILDAESDTKPARPTPPSRFRATFFDYTRNRTIYATGNINRPSAVTLAESNLQPRPSQDEFDEAVGLVMKERELGGLLKSKRVKPYPAMPPLIAEELPDGRIERTISVGLMPDKGQRGHEIVGVNMIRKSVLRFEQSQRGRAPLMSAAHNPICGLPNAYQSTLTNTPGQAWVTVTQGGTALWKFLVVRPAGSSGTNGSGIELRFVDYRGKRVLYRAHVPILNVQYDGNACGPYRDWQNQEGMLQAVGSDPVPGFRLCTAPATTILDTGSDVGNFLGVAIYVQGQEVVLVSEMEAGWYRYISQWRFHTDGTIRPRFGFSAVQNSCVCHIHHHHAYWRFDFDLRTPGDNLVREFNDPPLFAASNWHDKNYEISRPRDPSRKRKWRVQNKITGESYDIIPGANDGVATAQPDWPFGRGDVWIVRYHGTEIDDGVIATGPPYEANIAQWVNGEPINGQDVVIWYAAHFTHDVNAQEPGEFGHIVGPDLKQAEW